MAGKLGRPARPRPTPRGIAGRKVMLYLDPIVQRFVPLDRMNDCIARHRGGQKHPVTWDGQCEPVFRTTCRYDGFEFWVVEFPKQRKLFLGPPEFFRDHLR